MDDAGFYSIDRDTTRAEVPGQAARHSLETAEQCARSRMNGA
jgi:hypothetical protein